MVAALMVEGRPLRGRNGRVHRARARRGYSHLTDRQAMHLRQEVRHALAEHWKAQGELEHSSVVAYQDLARRLALLDAPADLVRRALSAAVQEADHWTRCFELAGRYLGQSLRPGRLRRPLRLPRSRSVELAALAVETLRDGMLLEAYAASMAGARAARAYDARVVESLCVFAADEAVHAALSADVLDWCLAQGGAPIVEAVETAAAQLPDHPPVLASPLGLDAPFLADHGLFDADPHHEVWAALVASTRAEVACRLADRTVRHAA
jgi:hypothetical protein